MVLDLEDAVRPSVKQSARKLVAEFLKENRESASPIYVRINPVESAVLRRSRSDCFVLSTVSAWPRLNPPAKSPRLTINFPNSSCAPAFVPAQRVLCRRSKQQQECSQRSKLPDSRVLRRCASGSPTSSQISTPKETRTSLRRSTHFRSWCSHHVRQAFCRLSPPAHTKLDDTEGLLSTCELYRRLGVL